MPDARDEARPVRPIATLLLACLAIGGGAGPSMADRITVRGGGQLKGKLIADKAHPGQYLYIGEVGRTPMPFKKDQIVQVTPEKSALDEYVVLLEKERPTAEAEFALGTWCEENNLLDLAQVHFDHAVKRDSTFEPAHRKLGHVSMGGRWLNAEEVKEAQGLIKYKGRWITPEEKERREMLVATAAEGSTWVRRIKLLRDAYLSGPGQRGQDAERRLLAIDESAAVGPILKVLGEDPIPAIRTLASRILGGIAGPEATSGLVGRLLGEEDEAVRQATMNEVSRRDPADVLPLLTRGLRSAHHEVVNRSAWGLGNLNAAVAVPKLVPALITIEYEVVMVSGGSSTPAPSFTPSPPNAGFLTENGGGYSLPVLTPPVVGPGVVAFGASSVPYGALNGSSINIGAGGGRGPIPRLVPIEHQNREVLDALIKMTGRDFGFDIPTWKRWVATSFKVESAPTRRVPEP